MQEHRDHTSGDVTCDGRNQYLYDAEGRICAVHDKTSGVAQPNTEYIYNADGTRVAKGYLSSWPGIGSACPAPASGNFTLTREYLLDSGADQVTELNGSGAWQHSNAFQGGRLTATYDAAGLHYAIADPLGTKRVQFSLTASGSSQLDEKCKSLPFGNDLGNPRQASCSGTVADATEHHFTGKERDAESGNDYFGARYYSSAMGRFMSPDWSAKVEPVPYAKLNNPQSFNLYSYVQNNPLMRLDSDGHDVALGNEDAKNRSVVAERVTKNLSSDERKMISEGVDGKTGKHILQQKAGPIPGARTAAFTRLSSEISDHSHTATVQIQSTYRDDSGQEQSVASHSGGGVTIPQTGGNSLILLSPEGNLNPGHPPGATFGLMGTVPGFVPDPTSIIAGHELMGHGYENMTAGHSSEGTVRQFENQMRQEQGLPPRE